MTCNIAVSIAKAAVTKEHLLELLTSDVLQRVVLTYLQSEYAALSPRVEYVYGDMVAFGVGDLDLVIQQGAVQVNTSRRSASSKAEKLAQQVEQLVTRLADSLFQQKVQQALGTAVSQVQQVEVDNDGVRQQAVVFTLNL